MGSLLCCLECECWSTAVHLSGLVADASMRVQTADGDAVAFAAAGRHSHIHTPPQSSGRHTRTRVAHGELRVLQASGKPVSTGKLDQLALTFPPIDFAHARQYDQHRCACDQGTCPRMAAVRPLVDAYLFAAAQPTRSAPRPLMHLDVDALYRVTASLATFDERRKHDVIFVRTVHCALIAAGGDEALAFAVIAHQFLTASPPQSIGCVA